MIFDESIDNNENISKDFKEIAKECFSNIYQTLGKNKFSRWIHTRELSEDVKTMIFDWMTEDEIKENPTLNGFENDSENKIKIKSREGFKKTAIHESWHYMTKHSAPFCTYINEGLTEYMTGKTLYAESYPENRIMVEFLHEMLGDSFIKAYLLRKR